MTTTDIVPAENIAALDTLDAASREVAITGMLDQARTWLAHAVESSAPAQDIANFKAYIATAAETARRLKVSKEIQVDAEVMVRRTERALGQAIRTGQEHGEIAVRGQGADVRPPRAHRDRSDSGISLPTAFATAAELSGNGGGIYAMTDDVTDEQFDQALQAAQDEENVSRANVVRKVREIAQPSWREQQDEKWERVEELAERGYASAQVAREVGMSEDGLRAGARHRGIEFRADKHVGRSRRLDMRRVISETAYQLESIAETTNNLISVDGIRAAGIAPEEIQTWVDSLTNSIAALSKARKTIKESIS